MLNQLTLVKNILRVAHLRTQTILIQTSENIDPYLDTRENITSCSCSSTTMPKAAKTSQTLTVAQVKKMTVVHRLKIKGEDQQEVIVPGDWYVLSWQFTPSVVLTWYQPFSCPCRHWSQQPPSHWPTVLEGPSTEHPSTGREYQFVGCGLVLRPPGRTQGAQAQEAH